MRTQKPLPNPPVDYDAQYMYDLASLVIDEEQSTLKIDRDNVITTGSIIFKDEENNLFYRLKVAGGVLSVVLVETVGNRPVTSTNPYVS
jgi:hypothetical protein